MVVTSALGVFFIFIVLGLIARRLLLPGILILGSFILFVLWLTGLIETALQLYGIVGNINDNCQIYVVENVARGNSIDTLAWLTQITICEFLKMASHEPSLSNIYSIGNCWKTAFAFEVVNCVFYIWMIVMSWQVHRDFYR